MAQTPWQDLIPYYVARSLPPVQMQAFEAQLARDTDLRREVEEWRRIAAAVWREADSAARRLPPLSPEVYQKLQYRNGAQPTTATGVMPGVRVQHKSRLSNSPLMMVAGFLVVFLCGGIILFSAARQLQPEVIDGTNVALNATSEFGGPAGLSATPSRQATMVPSLAVVIDTGESTWTPAPRGTATPVLVRPVETHTATRRPQTQVTATPQGNSIIVGTPIAPIVNVPMTQTYEFVYGTATQWPDYLCVVTNNDGGAQPLYAYADYSAPVVGYWSAGETTWVMARTASNWIEIFYGQWLPAGNLVFKGPCDSVPEPSPTPVSTGNGECMVTNTGIRDVILYQSASTQAQVVSYLPIGQSTSVFVRASNNWFETFYNGQLAWFLGDGVTFTGDCVNIPVPSPTYTPEPTSSVPDLSQQIPFGVSTFAVLKAQGPLYFGPSTTSGNFLTIEAGMSLPAYGTLAVDGVEWVSILFDNSIVWIERSRVNLTNSSSPTATLPAETPVNTSP